MTNNTSNGLSVTPNQVTNREEVGTIENNDTNVKTTEAHTNPKKTDARPQESLENIHLLILPIPG